MRTLALVLLLATPLHADNSAPSKPTRVELASKVYAITEIRYRSGTETLEAVYTWSRRWLDAARAAGIKTAAQDHGKRMQALAAEAKARTAAGAASTAEALAVEYFCAEAETFISK